MVLNEPPIMQFLARSPIKEDVELLQRFRTHVQSPNQDASRVGDFRKAGASRNRWNYGNRELF